MAIRQLSTLRRTVAACVAFPFILFLDPSCSIGASAQLIDCYRWDGTIAANNTRCPGSNACCGTGSVCLSNRLCTADGNPNSKAKLVRGPCAVNGWDDSCAQICMYKEGKRFPRVGTCPDGSLCCDDDPDCCEKGLGIFLDESGNRVSTRATAYTTRYPPTAGGASRYTLMPSSDVASSTSISTSTSEGAASTTSASHSTSGTLTLLGASDTEASSDSPATMTLSNDALETTSSTQPSPSPSSNPNDSLGLKLGLGLGIPAAALATGVAMYFWGLRPRGHRASGGAAEGATGDSGYSPGPDYGGAQPIPPPMYRVVNPYPVEIGAQGPSELFVPNPGAPHSPVPITPKLQ